MAAESLLALIVQKLDKMETRSSEQQEQIAKLQFSIAAAAATASAAGAQTEPRAEPNAERLPQSEPKKKPKPKAAPEALPEKDDPEEEHDNEEEEEDDDDDEQPLAATPKKKNKPAPKKQKEGDVSDKKAAEYERLSKIAFGGDAAADRLLMESCFLSTKRVSQDAVTNFLMNPDNASFVLASLAAAYAYDRNKGKQGLLISRINTLLDDKRFAVAKETRAASIDKLGESATLIQAIEERDTIKLTNHPSPDEAHASLANKLKMRKHFYRTFRLDDVLPCVPRGVEDIAQLFAVVYKPNGSNTEQLACTFTNTAQIKLFWPNILMRAVIEAANCDTRDDDGIAAVDTVAFGRFLSEKSLKLGNIRDIGEHAFKGNAEMCAKLLNAVIGRTVYSEDDFEFVVNEEAVAAFQKKPRTVGRALNKIKKPKKAAALAQKGKNGGTDNKKRKRSPVHAMSEAAQDDELYGNRPAVEPRSFPGFFYLKPIGQEDDALYEQQRSILACLDQLLAENVPFQSWNDVEIGVNIRTHETKTSQSNKTSGAAQGEGGSAALQTRPQLHGTSARTRSNMSSYVLTNGPLTDSPGVHLYRMSCAAAIMFNPELYIATSYELAQIIDDWLDEKIEDTKTLLRIAYTATRCNVLDTYCLYHMSSSIVAQRNFEELFAYLNRCEDFKQWRIDTGEMLMATNYFWTTILQPPDVDPKVIAERVAALRKCADFLRTKDIDLYRRWRLPPPPVSAVDAAADAAAAAASLK